MLFVVIGTSTCSPNTCYQIEYKNKNSKISKIPRYEWCCELQKRSHILNVKILKYQEE
jgi:hypothetical protein